jgi:uncharacterized protein YjiS (DUF1127 family)
MTTVTKTSALHDEISATTYAFVQRTEAVALSVLSTIAVWHNRHQGRRELAELSNHALADIGLTRAAALSEIDKPFWRA